MSDPASRRVPWVEGPGGGEDPEGWLSLGDDDLLHRIQALGPGHDKDAVLLGIVRSRRHFFVRQEAAKKVRDSALLRELADDRHIGQILVRAMNRHEDLDYLQRLVEASRHLEVRNAAEAQLRSLRQRLGRGRP